MLTKDDLVAISDKIRDAERMTSGEIRVYVAKRCNNDPLEEAVRVFERLEMHKTALRNGVLIYVSPADHKMAIYGDEGINEKQGNPAFWQEALALMTPYFQEEKIKEGICVGVEKVGKLIKEIYPVAADDINELDNDVIVEE
ncbi:MAG: TPM domain-containing protein [Fermentimonas sp.]|jgi:uncharacterized membrane protein